MLHKHASTRNVIERAFGVLKARWRCLFKALELSVMNVCTAVNACFVLHNICIDRGEPEPSLEDVDYLAMKAAYDLMLSSVHVVPEAEPRGRGPPPPPGVRDALVAYVNA